MRKLKSVVVTIIKKYLRLIKHKRVKRVQKALELKIKTGEISPPHLPVYSFGVRIKWSPNLQADGYVYTAEFLFDEELFSTKKYTFISESNDVQLKVTPRRVAHSLPHGRNVDAMVIVPHGDDELFLCGSIIREKVLAGEYVIVAFINNCDHNGRENARLRHMQSVAAMDLLGLSAEHIVLLGYSNTIITCQIPNKPSTNHHLWLPASLLGLFYPKRSLCVPVRERVNTITSSSMR
jgi:hypothetical protein